MTSGVKLIMSIRGGWNLGLYAQRELAIAGAIHVPTTHPNESVRMEFPDTTRIEGITGRSVHLSIPYADGGEWYESYIIEVIENYKEYEQQQRERDENGYRR